MALTKTTLPGITPTFAVPYDTLQAFCSAQTLTASGYASNLNTQLTMGPGRFNGVWALDVSNVALGSSNEFYQFWLLGSNDAAFANGNIETLAMHDIAATAALRTLANICAVSPTIPEGTGRAGTIFVKPWVNQVGEYVFEYMQLYVLMGGTSPGVTFSSWVSPASMGDC
ncbi:MAG: hypothetical protein KGJ45_11650 [Elusimicrobia bacterium]|nr:hypothetical protein [Elusimicrobiota bacterium]